jgi:uncharacterized paraquat-inducible protein A
VSKVLTSGITANRFVNHVSQNPTMFGAFFNNSLVIGTIRKDLSKHLYEEFSRFRALEVNPGCLRMCGICFSFQAGRSTECCHKCLTELLTYGWHNKRWQVGVVQKGKELRASFMGRSSN